MCVFYIGITYIHGLSQNVQPTSTVHGVTVATIKFSFENQPPLLIYSMRNVLVNVTYGIINIFHHSSVSSQMHWQDAVRK